MEIKIVNKEAATKRKTLLHAQRQFCMVFVPLNKALLCYEEMKSKKKFRKINTTSEGHSGNFV